MPNISVILKMAFGALSAIVMYILASTAWQSKVDLQVADQTSFAAMLLLSCLRHWSICGLRQRRHQAC